MKILAIDPGASGGFAWIDNDGQILTEPMPDGMTNQIDALRTIAVFQPGIRCVMEKVGSYMPGNSGPAAATFARHCGSLETALYCFGVPTEQVLPKKWQAIIGSLSAEKPERKRQIKDAMQRRYPHLSVTLKTADALGILTYAMEAKP